MARPIKVLVSCGAGMATSTIVAEEVKEMMHDNKIQGTVTKCNTLALKDSIEGKDVVFLTTMYQLPENVKWANVSALISGINEDQCREKMIKLMREASEEDN